MDTKIPSTARGYENFEGTVDRLASRSRPEWRKRAAPDQNAPNIVLMLMDDMGFSDIGSFGSEIPTPNLDALAEAGVVGTNYHTPPMCAPARASLMTGLNPHRAGFAYVPHADPGFPNYTMELPEHVPTLPETLRAAGYATFMVGKWHLTPEAQLGDAGDKSSWPLQRGFDRYFGCMDGFTSMFHPHRLIRDNSPVQVDEYPDDFYLTDALTDEALDMLSQLEAGAGARKPFFLYFAHQAVHGPLQAKQEDIEKHQDVYAAGWDQIRQERFARQLQKGLFPEGTQCPLRDNGPEEVQPWETLSLEQKALFARHMAVYAAMVDNIDQNVGRLVERLKELGQYENTIFMFTSDNGGTAEGGPNGTRSYFSQFASLGGLPTDWVRDVPRPLDLVGGPQVFSHYPRGWAHASNTPFRMYKTHTLAGGVRVPFLLSWPHGLMDATGNRVRNGFMYSADVMPTLLDMANVAPMNERHGQPAWTSDGRSQLRMLAGEDNASGDHVQYFELQGRRALVSGRWKLVSIDRMGPGWDADAWQLYDVKTDPTETRDLASVSPQLVRQLASLWDQEAWRNTVFPLNDDGSLLHRRPVSEHSLEQPLTLYRHSGVLERFRSLKLTKLRSFEIQLRFSYGLTEAGVLVSHGDQGGGYVLHVTDKSLHLSYNVYGDMRRTSAPLPRGSHRIIVRFEALPEMRWRITICDDKRSVKMLKMEVPMLIGMCPLTGISVGADRGGPVDWDLYERYRSYPYSGLLSSVTYIPGVKAHYNPEIIAAVDERAAMAFD